MLERNFFHKFFQNKKLDNHKIVKYNSNQNDLEDQINIQLTKINQEISESSEALIQAQIIKLKYKVSNAKNVLNKIGEKIYKKKLDDSINWYQINLKDLYTRRLELQIKLEKIKGVYWINRIKRLLKIALIVIFILFNLFIFFSGFLIIIYLLPLIILISLVYYIYTKKY